MTNRTAAVRYARALFDVNLKNGDLRTAESDLDGFIRLVDGHPMLRRALFASALRAPTKRAIINDLRNRARSVAPVSRLLILLADRGRLALLPDIARFYRARVFEHHGVVDAQVTTAQPLSPEQSDAIRKRLAGADGARDVRMTSVVDPAILGGVVTRIGSTVYDGSVAGHLERMRQTLLEP